jgi:NAD(P)-dependent dehydrogenase (short-subunit alcohol dehydrogenase family)
MIAQGEGGSIVNIGSGSGIRSAAYHAVCGAATVALMQLTNSMAMEWSRHGIRANCVVPGSVLTERNLASCLDYGKRTREWGPLGVPVRADDIDAALFLLSNVAERIAGQILSVDEGVTSTSPIGDSSHRAQRMVPEYHARHYSEPA